MENEKAKFLAYEDVREGGQTNMFDVRMVQMLADVELSKHDIMYIMQHYSELKAKHLDVCPDCEGTGVTVIPAYQQGGEIIGSKEVECVCQVEARAELSANNEIDR